MCHTATIYDNGLHDYTRYIMQHKVNLDEISNGTLYEYSDMIRIGCDGCNGSASCCRFAEDTITLDPYDIWQLMQALKLNFEQLFSRQMIALSPVNGLLLPHLNFRTDNGSCPFLLEAGRCSIHAHRPGLCRLFPLARLIAENKVQYLMQIHECPYTGAPKTKIKNWLEIPGISHYEDYLIRWNNIVSVITQKLATADGHDSLTAITSAFLRTFFFTPYDPDKSFYEQFDLRVRDCS